MDRPPVVPAKLLAHWMEWESGDVSPGTLLKDLKIGGLRELLEEMVDGKSSEQEPATEESTPDESAAVSQSN